MTTYTVGTGGDFLTISAAMAGGSGVVAGDTIDLLAGYTGESATVTLENLTFNGDASNTGIALGLYHRFQRRRDHHPRGH